MPCKELPNSLVGLFSRPRGLFQHTFLFRTKKAAKSNISEQKKMFEPGSIRPEMQIEFEENSNTWVISKKANNEKMNHQKKMIKN